ncbi:MAG: RNA polymerase sigma factor [Kofleriaceae bacterium]
MKRLVRGDDAAFRTLVVRYRGRVFHLALAITGDEAAAEDALQDTFLAVHRSAASFGGTAFRAWLFTIARHAAIRPRRRHVPIPVEEETLEALGEAAGWGADDELDENALRSRLAGALANLAPPDREVLVLRDLEERSAQETATMLGLTVQATKSRLHRARLRLAAALRGGDHGS